MNITIINNPFKSNWKRELIRELALYSVMDFAIIDQISEVRIIYNQKKKSKSGGYYSGYYELYNRNTKVVTIRVDKDDKTWLSWRIPHELWHAKQFIEKELQIGPKERFLTYNGKRYGKTKYSDTGFFRENDLLDGDYPYSYVNRYLPWETIACIEAEKYRKIFGRV